MKRNISLLLLALACLTGCSIDEQGSPGGTKGEAEGILFEVNLPSQNGAPASYADYPMPADESKVDHIDVFAFEKSGDEYVYVENQRGTGISNDKRLVKTFRARFGKLEPGEAYRFVVLANARDQVNQHSYSPGQTMGSIMRKFKVTYGKEWEIDKMPIPMWGMSEDETMKEKGMEIKKFYLLRMLARIDVTSEVAPAVFKLASVRLYRHRTGGYVVPAPENRIEDARALVSKPTLLGDRVMDAGKPLVYEDIKNNKCLNRIYTFETDSALLTEQGEPPYELDEKNAHCLVIGGVYDSNPDNDTTYYKVYFKRDIDDVVSYPSLLRNHLYILNITDVKSKGYETPKEALEARDVEFSEAIVLEWNYEYKSDVVLGEGDDAETVSIEGNPIDRWEGEPEDTELTTQTPD